MSLRFKHSQRDFLQNKFFFDFSIDVEEVEERAIDDAEGVNVDTGWVDVNCNTSISTLQGLF